MATTTTAPIKPLLPVKDPVPSDIEIAQSIKPKHISQIAEVVLELRPEEYELYGPTKAKVSVDGKAKRSQIIWVHQQDTTWVRAAGAAAAPKTLVLLR